MTQKEYRIMRRTGAKVEWLRHEGHSHYWTINMTEAMVYSKLQVAIDLCKQKTGTEVQITTGETAFVNPI